MNATITRDLLSGYAAYATPMELRNEALADSRMTNVGTSVSLSVSVSYSVSVSWSWSWT
jgi:hypothetical protein